MIDTREGLEEEDGQCEFLDKLTHDLEKGIPDLKVGAKDQKCWRQHFNTGVRRVHFECIFYGEPGGEPDGEPHNDFGIELHFQDTDIDVNLERLVEIENHKDEIDQIRDRIERLVTYKGAKPEVAFVRKFPKGASTAVRILWGDRAPTDRLKTWALETMVIFYGKLNPIIQRWGPGR
jgi:hypothetical protein